MHQCYMWAFMWTNSKYQPLMYKLTLQYVKLDTVCIVWESITLANMTAKFRYQNRKLNEVENYILFNVAYLKFNRS